MKGKVRIQNKKDFIMGIVAILILGMITLCSSVRYNSSDNLQTHLGKAQYNDYPFTGEDLVKAAIEVLNTGKYYDCSGFVKQSLSELGAVNMSASSSMNWNSGNFTYQFEGTTYGTNLLASGNNDKIPWYEKIDKSIDDIPMGSVVSGSQNPGGSGHVFIYIGKFDTEQDLRDYAKNVLGIEITGKVNPNNKGQGSSHWFIEGNTSGGTSIRNYTWTTRQGDKSMKITKV